MARAPSMRTRIPGRPECRSNEAGCFREARTIDQRQRAGAAQSVYGIDKRLPVRDAAKINRRIAVPQILQCFNDGDLGPALRIGFCGSFRKRSKASTRSGIASSSRSSPASAAAFEQMKLL